MLSFVVIDVNLSIVVVDIIVCYRSSGSECSYVVVWSSGNFGKYKVFPKAWCSGSFNM